MLSQRKETVFFSKKALFIFFFVNLPRFFTYQFNFIPISTQKTNFL